MNYQSEKRKQLAFRKCQVQGFTKEQRGKKGNLDIDMVY